MLKDFLGGNSKTLMMVCISPRVNKLFGYKFLIFKI